MIGIGKPCQVRAELQAAHRNGDFVGFSGLTRRHKAKIALAARDSSQGVKSRDR
jgi:hypothetical protein